MMWFCVFMSLINSVFFRINGCEFVIFVFVCYNVVMVVCLMIFFVYIGLLDFYFGIGDVCVVVVCVNVIVNSEGVVVVVVFVFCIVLG